MTEYAYAPGTWTALAHGGRAALLDPAIDADAVGQIWESLSDGGPLESWLEVLAGNGLAALPSFGFVEPGDDGVRVVVRGEVVAVVDDYDISAGGMRTWREHVAPAETGVVLQVDGGEARFPLVGGVVLAATLQVGEVAAPAASAGAVETETEAGDGDVEPAPAASGDPEGEWAERAEAVELTDLPDGAEAAGEEPLGAPLDEPTAVEPEFDPAAEQQGEPEQQGEESVEAEAVGEPEESEAQPEPEESVEVAEPEQPAESSEVIEPAQDQVAEAAWQEQQAEPEGEHQPEPEYQPEGEHQPEAAPESGPEYQPGGEHQPEAAPEPAYQPEAEQQGEPELEQELPPVDPEQVAVGEPQPWAVPAPAPAASQWGPPPAAPVAEPQPAPEVDPGVLGDAGDHGDHDGFTIRAGDLPDHAPVEATLAPAQEEQGQPSQVPAPPAVQLSLSTGQQVELDRPVLIGRAPESSRFGFGETPRLVTVPSPQQDISRTHVEVKVEGDHVLVTDLRSTNGTVVVLPGSPPRRLHPGESVPVPAGTVVDLGDGITAVVATSGSTAPLAY